MPIVAIFTSKQTRTRAARIRTPGNRSGRRHQQRLLRGERDALSSADPRPRADHLRPRAGGEPGPGPRGRGGQGRGDEDGGGLQSSLGIRL